MKTEDPWINGLGNNMDGMSLVCLDCRTKHSLT